MPLPFWLRVSLKNVPHDALRWLGAFSLVAAVWLALLLSRKLGLHIDENNYFRMAHTTPFGDSASSGKPFVFYAVNYLFMNALGRYLGPLHAISLHLFYMTLLLAGCAFLARNIREEQEQRLWLFIAICTSPFVVFNSTQLMMENAQYPVLALLFAILLKPGSAATFDARRAVFLLGVLAVFIKETSVAPLLVFAFAFREKKAGLWPVWAAAAIGIALAFVASQGGVDPPERTYGSLTTLVGLDELGTRLSRSLQFAWTFLFLLTLPLAAAIAAGRKREPVHFRIVLAAGVAALLIGFISKEDFVRYAYPVVFLALISGFAIASSLQRWVLPAVVACGLIPIWNMWTGDGESRLSLWPPILTRELYFSGFTVMPGAALHAWSVSSGRKKDGLCLLITERNSENPRAIANYFKYVGSNVRIFAESDVLDFERCQGPRAVVRRQYADQPSDCAPQCPAGSSVENCTRQEMRGWATRDAGVLTNKTCLP